MDPFNFLSSPAASALGYSILYSVGQAFVVFICLRIVLKLIPQASAHAKYALSYCAYLAIGGWFAITLFHQLSLAQSDTAVQSLISGNSIGPDVLHDASSVSSFFSLSFLNEYLPLVVAFYLMGVLWYAARLAVNFLQTYTLRSKGLFEIDDEWKHHILALAERMRIGISFRTFFSTRVNTPMMIGFFKPVILLPLAAMNQLTAEQFEAILLHELAHIRRNDYLLNIVQSVLDAIFFFNPFTWWITKNIRQEREKSCDEIVLQQSNPYHYARALLALEEPLRNQPLIMTAVNDRSHLFHRIKNIMEMKNKHINLRQKFITLLVVGVATISVAWLSPADKKVTQNLKAATPSTTFFATSIPTGFTFFPFVMLSDSTPSERVAPPAPPLPPAPPAPPVAMQRDGSAPLPPVPPVAPMLPGNAPVAPLPPTAPLPPVPMGQLKDTFPSASGYFNSKEWKQQEEAIKKSTQEMRKYFQSDEWKKQQNLMRENALAMKKYFSSPEWKQQQELMKKNGEEMKKYFNSPEWKKQQELMKKNGEEMKKYFNSPEWKKQQELMKKNGEEMKKYFNSDEWKKQQEEFKKDASKMKEYFNSPEWKKQQEDIRHATDSLTAFFKSDVWKQQQENIQKAVAKTQEFFKSDEWKKVQEDLQQIQSDQQKSRNDTEIKNK